MALSSVSSPSRSSIALFLAAAEAEAGAGTAAATAPAPRSGKEATLALGGPPSTLEVSCQERTLLSYSIIYASDLHRSR